MSAETLLALAARVEAAEGPSAAERQLVIDAYNLIFPHELRLTEEEKGDQETRLQRMKHRVRFTSYINTDYDRASLDAAVMLVPEGQQFGVEHYPWSEHPTGKSCAWAGNGGKDIPRTGRIAAATPALALTAAALRARASQEPQS